MDNPITVRRVGRNRYQVVAGEHRFLAARRVSWTSVPVQIVHRGTLHALLDSLSENLNRRGICPLLTMEKAWMSIVLEHRLEEAGRPHTLAAIGHYMKFGESSVCQFRTIGEAITPRMILEHAERLGVLPSLLMDIPVEPALALARQSGHPEFQRWVGLVMEAHALKPRGGARRKMEELFASHAVLAPKSQQNRPTRPSETPTASAEALGSVCPGWKASKTPLPPREAPAKHAKGSRDRGLTFDGAFASLLERLKGLWASILEGARLRLWLIFNS